MKTERIDIINTLHKAKGCHIAKNTLVTIEMFINLDKIEYIKMNGTNAYPNDFEIKTIAGISINYYDNEGKFEMSI